MSQAEMNKNLDEKKKILSWLIQNKTRELNEVGKVMNLYYNNKEMLREALRKNDLKMVLTK